MKDRTRAIDIIGAIAIGVFAVTWPLWLIPILDKVLNVFLP